MEWSHEFTLQFLEAYHAEPVLWDRTHEHYKKKRKQHEAWCRVSTDVNRPVEELKKKMYMLLSTFRGYRRKKIAARASGDFVYNPVWFAFEYMEQFLSPVYEVTQNVNTDKPPVEDEVTTDDVDEGTGDTLLRPKTFQKSPSPPCENPPSARQQLNSWQTIRQRQNSMELQEAENQMWESFMMPQNVVSNKSEANENEEDECDLYGKLLAKKLRKLPEEEREILMYEIDGILLNRRQKLSGI